jgi:hypothetical protein
MNRVQDLTDMILEILENHAGFEEWFYGMKEDDIEKTCEEIDEAIQTWANFEETYEMDEE